MLNWPRVTCSSRPSILAFCSKRKFVIRATTPVLSRPITVIVANFFIMDRVTQKRGPVGLRIIGKRRETPQLEWRGERSGRITSDKLAAGQGARLINGDDSRVRRHVR